MNERIAVCGTRLRIDNERELAAGNNYHSFCFSFSKILSKFSWLLLIAFLYQI
uniref:Uncharacterized protein n=1 Tax=Rhizophora mucronata TaxID=61149 RepID=A0A2P2QWW6_RHIMU